MKRLLLFLLFVSATQIEAQIKVTEKVTHIKYDPEIEERIKQFESGLYGRIKIEGDSNWTLKERMTYYKINGLSIAVVHNFKVEWAKSYGWADIAEKKPVTPETYFQIGSISKSLNAIGILKLEQENKLNINSDINNYLTSWRFPYDTAISHNKKITIANLLSHSAGLKGGGSDYGKQDTLPDVYNILDGTPPATSPPVRSIFEPGLKPEYSNGGVTISMLIITDIVKRVYKDYINEKILTPLKMTNTFYDEPAPPDRVKYLATGYDQSGAEVQGKYRLLTQQAGGAAWSTPTDFCKYIIETQLSYQGKSNKILSREITKQMLTPQIASSPNGDSIGLGVFVDQIGTEKYFKHSGSRNGFTSLYYASYEGGNAVVIFLNSTNNSSILQEIVNSVATVYKWKGFEKPVARKVIPISTVPMEKYEGIYSAENELIAILKKDGAYSYYASGKFVEMYFTTKSDFFNLEFLADKQFYFDEHGKAVGFKRIVGKKGFSKCYQN